MNFKAVLATLLLLGSGLCQRRVINGEVVKPYQFPFLVSIQINGFHSCGGSLLDYDTVLTAAHCQPKISLANYTVHAHRHNLNQTDAQEKGFSTKIKEFKIHHKYNATGLAENDIAILKLVTPIPKDLGVKFVKLNDDEDNDKIDTVATIAGWGVHKVNGTETSTLQLTGEVMIKDSEYCTQIFGKQYEGIVCTVATKKNTVTCQGDSGGPLFTEKPDGNVVQLGLVSEGPVGCSPLNGLPTVFTSVRAFIPWIKENVGLDYKMSKGVKGWIKKLVKKSKHIFNH